MTRKEIIHEIWNEREQQGEREGYDEYHDDGPEHDAGQLSEAAAAYCLGATRKAANLWPWGDGFKPKDRRRDLIRAAALIVAEIERLDRIAALKEPNRG